MPKYESFKRKLNSKEQKFPTTEIILTSPSEVPVSVANYLVLSSLPESV
jgi:hypothetical protein